jgi:RimJ/RimL family protein N-acetyltransferase
MIDLMAHCGRLRLRFVPNGKAPVRAGLVSGVYHLDFDRQHVGIVSLVETGPGHADIGYGVERAFRGMGLATRAVAAVTASADQLGVAVLHAQTRSNNVPSRRILEKNGFSLRSTAPFGPHAQDSQVAFMVYQWTAVSPERDITP